MNKNYQGDWQAKILSYDAASRSAKISIPTITDGIEGGITATFAYPIGDDDLDTEREVLNGADCYIFFLQGRPEAPVIWAYSSHGEGAAVDVRRIRQENIELLARANITLKAEEMIDLSAKKVRITATESFEVISPESTIKGNSTTTGNSVISGNNTVAGKSTLTKGANIEGVEFGEHAHRNVRNGDNESGGVVGF